MAKRTGIAACRIAETPIAILDFETTGLRAGFDRVVEVSVVRCDPGKEPRLALDTLVNPMRPMAATRIHGITDDDVADAPRFSDIAGDVVGALSGCAVAAYNVYFDMSFLSFELRSAGVRHKPPYFCLMHMRPLLGLGPRCNLEEACRLHGITYDGSHMAANDAMVCRRLLTDYLRVTSERGVETFGDLAHLRRYRYKFLDSFGNDPFPHPSTFQLSACERLCSRIGRVHATAANPARQALSLGKARDLVHTLPRERKPPDPRPTVCFTGFAEPEKELLTGIATRSGFRVVHSVLKNLTTLCCGPAPGSVKLEEAKGRGVRIVSEAEFRNELQKPA